MIWLYGALGGILGTVFSLIFCSLIQNWEVSNPAASNDFESAYSGVSGAFLTGIVTVSDAVFGGITGCLLVHIYGKYRRAAAFGLVVLGGLAAFVSAWQVFSFAKSYGREAALAVFGVYFLWSLVLVFAGFHFIGKDINSAKSDLQ